MSHYPTSDCDGGNECRCPLRALKVENRRLHEETEHYGKHISDLTVERDQALASLAITTDALAYSDAGWARARDRITALEADRDALKTELEEARQAVTDAHVIIGQLEGIIEGAS